MGLIALSTLLSIILGSCLWLLVGSQFPRGQADKWPVTGNILCYAALIAVPVYLAIFFIFQGA
ncbi:MAG: hypothetical protein ACR2PJ_07655 [Pseudomonadales bacterium]